MSYSNKYIVKQMIMVARDSILNIIEQKFGDSKDWPFVRSQILKILSEQEYDEYMEELERKEQAAYEAEINAQFIKDKKLIQEYALSQKLRTRRTSSGLSYVITKKGKGENAKVDDELEVTYEGYLLNGKPFDATKGKETYKFPLGNRKVIQGWEEGLLHFAEGSEGILIIPSKMAYGPRAIYEENVAIPANSVLVFKIKVERIRRAEKEEVKGE